MMRLHACLLRSSAPLRASAIGLCQRVRRYSTLLEPRIVNLNSRKIVRVAGADALKVVQNLVTNDMRHLSSASPCLYTAVLNPLGRVMYDVLVYFPKERHSEGGTPTELLLEVDEGGVDGLCAHLKKYKLRAKATIAPATDLSVRALLGPKDAIWPLADTSYTAASVDPRIEAMGVRIIGGSGGENGAKPMTEDEYAVYRYTLGVAEGPRDIIPNEAFPLESNFEILNGVNFDKGCYLGQELTARAKFVGVTRKRLMPLAICPPIEPDSMPEPGAEILKDGKPVGKFRNAVGAHGLGLLRLDSVTKGRGESLSMVGKGGATTYSLRAYEPDWWPKDARGKDPDSSPAAAADQGGAGAGGAEDR